MIYFLSILALTLNPFLWITLGKQRWFQASQVFRLIVGIVVIFFLSYVGLIDHSLEAFIKDGLFFIGLSMFADIAYIKVKQAALTVFIGILLLLASVYFATIYPLTITKDKYNYVKKKVTVVSSDKSTMDEQHIPVVPKSYARYRSEKVLGELKHASYYDLGDSTIQKIDNHLYWVTPIEYTGFFKWIKGSTAPGFIKISAEDENAEAQLIKKDMKYVPSAYFSKDLMRHVRSAHKDTILLEPSFEPSDDNTPYYVIPYGKYEKFREVIDIKGVYLVNPENGSIKTYTLDNLPAFIDNAIPTSVAADWNDWYGKYVHGYWNAKFSQEDVKRPTHSEDIADVNGVFNRSLALNWFTDFTRPKSNSGSMIGYTLINGRTGAISYYKEGNGLLNGKSAMNVAEKTFRSNKYNATTPTLYKIYNQFTWVVPLTDSNHVIRQIMLINAKNEKIYSAADNKRDLFDNYQYTLATKMGADTNTPTNIANQKEINGTLTHVYKSENGNGSTQVKFMLDKSNRIFMVSSTEFPYSIFLEKGSKVKVKYIHTDEIQVSVNDLVINK